MATGGAPAPTSEDWRMHLTCSLCLDIFTDPKVIPGCLHTYCLKCLEELAAQHTTTFPCPECRATVQVPAGGVAAFQLNRFLRSQDLAKARDGAEGVSPSNEDNTKCSIHPELRLDQYCSDCQVVLCLRCVLKEHRHHVTKELHEAAAEAKTLLTQDLKRLQEAVSYMIGELEVEETDKQALQDKKEAVETAVHNRHATMVAMADKLRDDMLTSLNTTCSDIEKKQSKERQMKQNNLDTLLQLQQQALQAVSSDKPSQLLNACKVMKDGKGSSQNVNILKTPKRQFVTRPALTFKVSEDVGRKQIEDFVRGRVEKVTMKSTSPEVTVKQHFKCRPERDTEVFSLSPQRSGNVWVSYTRKGLAEDAVMELFSQEGRFLREDESRRGKVTMKALGTGNSSGVNHKEENFIRTVSKSPALSCTFIGMSYNISSETLNVHEVTLVSRDPDKYERKALFSVSQSGPQRACDVDSSQQLFVVLDDTQDTEKRRVHLYLRDELKAVATYTPPSPNSQLSDVCFMTLGGQELLIVADEGTDSLHVVRVTAGGLTFLRYLAPGCPLLVQPTALNTDLEGRLWVACRGGAILTMTPVK